MYFVSAVLFCRINKLLLLLLLLLLLIIIIISPKFISKAALISISKDLIKEINRLICGFIWRDNDKIRFSAIIIIDANIENRGLKLLDLDSVIQAQEE